MHTHLPIHTHPHLPTQAQLSPPLDAINQPITMLRTAVLLLLGGLGMLGAHAADPGLGSYMYGLRKINGTRWIVQYNPPIQQLEVVFDTGLDDSNALAFDTLRDQLIFLGEDFSNVESLYVWDIATETMTLIAPWAPLAAALGITTTDSAAFYNNAYWFVPERTVAAAQIIFIYTNGIPTGIASYNKYDFADQTVAPLMRFGDIAIDVSLFAWLDIDDASNVHPINACRLLFIHPFT